MRKKKRMKQMGMKNLRKKQIILIMLLLVKTVLKQFKFQLKKEIEQSKGGKNIINGRKVGLMLVIKIETIFMKIIDIEHLYFTKEEKIILQRD